MIKIIELFAGVGSQTQALKNIGVAHEVVGISEIDKYCLQSYELLHGAPNNLGGITKIDKLPYADLWVYSFPCQDVSVAGLNKGIKDGTRSGLLYHVLRLLEVSPKPKYLLMENVLGLLCKLHYKNFHDLQDRLSEIGYRSFSKVLNAKDFGIPQNRKRVFMVSIRRDLNEYYEFPKGVELEKVLLDMLEPEPVDEKLYLNEKKIRLITISNYAVKRVIARDLFSGVDNAFYYKNPTSFCIRENSKKGFAEASIGDGVNIANPQRTSSVVQSQRTGTITTRKDRCGVVTINGIRMFTAKECWRLMGWKDEQIDKVLGKLSSTQLYKQAGNGIVVSVLEAIFRELFKKE